MNFNMIRMMKDQIGIYPIIQSPSTTRSFHSIIFFSNQTKCIRKWHCLTEGFVPTQSSPWEGVGKLVNWFPWLSSLNILHTFFLTLGEQLKSANNCYQPLMIRTSNPFDTNPECANKFYTFFKSYICKKQY